MGQIHNELRRGAYSTALKNFLGSTDSEAGVERFGETLTPTIDAFRLPELNLPRGDRRYGRMMSAAAVAARFNGIQLLNPPNSGMIVVVEGVWFAVTGVGEVSIGDNSGAFANLQTNNGTPLDTRSSPAGPSSIAIVHMGDAATGVIADPVFRCLGTAERPQGNPPPFTLRPNSQVFILQQVANTALDAGFFWRERKANPEEL